MELGETNSELKHQLKSKEKVHKEVAKLKSIISTQDDTVWIIFKIQAACWAYQ